MKLKEFIKKYRLYSRTKWKFTDYIMKISEIIELDHDPICEKDKKPEAYICIRNREGYTVYIPALYSKEFCSNSDFYSSDYRYINISALKRIRKRRNYSSEVYSRVNPPSVKLKFIDYIEINKNDIYIIYTTDLNYDDDLYNELINYNKIE